MNTTFADAIDNTVVESRTANGAVTQASSLRDTVDFFFLVGAARNNPEIADTFVAALEEDRDIAIRTLLWARDCRGGAGERQVFRTLLHTLYEHDVRNGLNTVERIARRVPELGRWDDLLSFPEPILIGTCFPMIERALRREDDGLCAKWCPRKGPMARRLREFMRLTPKQYRKLIVNLSKTVEQQMCAQQWDQIEYSHVPSVAAARYRKAFYRNDPERFSQYVESLVKGETTVNAGAVFPHDVLKNVISNNDTQWYSEQPELDATELAFVKEQWDALPNWLSDNKTILPVCDVSGSMQVAVSGKTTALDVSVSLGLYIADKQTGPFKDVFMEFSGDSRIERLRGDVIAKTKQLVKSKWGMNTDLNRAFVNLLSFATENNIAQADMPDMLLIFSDMEFDEATKGWMQDIEPTNFEAARNLFEQAGYELPQVVFWNLNGRKGNVPVSYDVNGTALVSGFSPSLLKGLLAGEQLTPEKIMLETIMKDRYGPQG